MNRLNLKIWLINTRKMFNKLNSKIRIDRYHLNSKVGKGVNNLPFSAFVRKCRNKLHFQIGKGSDYFDFKIGINIHNLYPTIQGYALALTVLIDRFIIGKGKADENNRCNNYCSHKIFYENI